MDHLIRASQAGDESAFAALFEQYQRLVHRTAFLVLQSADEADDALQDVFLRVHQAIPSYDPERGAFSTWLHRITVNHCLNLLRKRRLPRLSIPEGAGADPVSPGPPLDDRLGAEDEMGRALDRLSDKLRVTVVLRYYDDLPYEEIARILDIPVGTVKSRLDQALRVLRRELQAAEPSSALHPVPVRGVTR